MHTSWATSSAMWYCPETRPSRARQYRTIMGRTSAMRTSMAPGSPCTARFVSSLRSPSPASAARSAAPATGVAGWRRGYLPRVRQRAVMVPA